jgi:hypothetical protein
MNKLATELQNLIESGSKKYPLPYKKGNSIRLGHVIIRAKKDGFILFDCKERLQICMTASKHGALAAAKTYLANQDINKVLRLDHSYSKHDNDCAFYSHTIKKAKNDFKKEIAQTRLDISEAERSGLVNDLEAIIFN